MAGPSTADRDVHVRVATPEDGLLLLAWRNDPTTRRMSLHPEPIRRSEHLQWYAKSLQDPTRIILIAECAGVAVGMCRFDIDAAAPATAEISINVAPEQRGRGLGGAIIDAAGEVFASMHPEVHTVTATIRPENGASVRLFESRGFRRTASAGDALTYERASGL